MKKLENYQDFSQHAAEMERAGAWKQAESAWEKRQRWLVAEKIKNGRKIVVYFAHIMCVILREDRRSIMAKFVARFYCLVEAVVEAESNEQVLELCDLNVCDVNKLPHTITEIDDVVEVEEV